MLQDHDSSMATNEGAANETQIAGLCVDRHRVPKTMGRGSAMSLRYETDTNKG